MSPRSKIQDTLILSPGIGAQGATWDQFFEKFRAHSHWVLPAVSRDVLRFGPDHSRLRERLEWHLSKAWSLLE
jgi:orotidine-5'-phosphate decarboxylase